MNKIYKYSFWEGSRVCTGYFVSECVSEVISILDKNGFRLLSVCETVFFHFSRDTIANWFHLLRLLIGQGFTLDKALYFLSKNGGFSLSIMHSVNLGGSFEDAISKHSVFVGSDSSRLVFVLSKFADLEVVCEIVSYYNNMISEKKSLFISYIRGPLVKILFCLFCIVVMIYITSFIETDNPFVAWLRGVPLYCFLFLLILFLYMIYILLINSSFITSLKRSFEFFVFCDICNKCFRSGGKIISVLDVSSGFVSDKRLKEDIQQVKTNILRGYSLYQSFGYSTFFSQYLEFANALERCGKFSELFQYIAESQKSRFDLGIKKLIEYVPIIITLLHGILLCAMLSLVFVYVDF